MKNIFQPYMRFQIQTVIICLLAFVLCSCQDIDPTSGYTAASLYRTDVKTVHVPIFKSKSFHRQIEFELTRAFCQQLELHTPFKVVSRADQADTILYGTVFGVSDRVLTQQRQLDRPTQNILMINIEVTWKNRRNNELLLDKKKIRISGDYAPLLASGLTGATKQAVNDLAVRIVQAMEKSW